MPKAIFSWAPTAIRCLTVTHTTPTLGVVNDGTDTLHNIERLQFADVTIETGIFTGALITDLVAQGTLTIDDPAGTPLPAATPPEVGDIRRLILTLATMA